MNRDKIINDYFEYLLHFIEGEKQSKRISYRKVLEYLHRTEFAYSIPMDENRAEDGIELRWRFAYDTGKQVMYDVICEYLDGPCSVLEMMVSLSLSCEEIMDDPNFGDRTSQWFWGMMVSLGLGSMTDDRFDEKYASYVLKRFLNRKYDSNGKGGLFTIKECDEDLRKVEIWHQLCWYLNVIT